jgi:cardiolipin-specific phospholipase
MGRSSRTNFKVTAKHIDTRARVEQAESFFTDSLEEWREKMGINKMTLVGHSLGGYLVTAYALKHPQHVSRLVLLSPAGVPANPDAETHAAEDELTRSRSNPDPADANAPPKEITNPKASDVSKIKKEQIEDKKQEKQNESLGRRLVRD